jgi:hypothetical protein
MKDMNTKTIISAVLLMIGLLFVGGNKVAHAEEFTNVAVTKLTTMEEWDKAVQVSYQKDFSLSKEENPEETIYLSFTLEKDGLVRIMQSIAYGNTGVSNVGAYSTKLYVYSDAAMANQVMEVSTPSKDGSESTYQYMEAGTYYIKSTSKYSWGYSTKYNKKICIGSVDADKLLKTTVKVNKTKNKATISVDSSAMGHTVDTLQYVLGNYTMQDIKNNKIWKTSEYALSGSYKATVSDNATGFSLNKNGTYTIRVNVKYTSDNKNNVSFSVPVKVSGLDVKKPVIKGVKNGKKYKKSVKITFSDKESGIKKATLNGKKIKSGKKVKKKGSYTLKVTDKAGNVSTVKFRIVK